MESWWTEIDDAVLGCLAEAGEMAPAEIGRRLGLSEGAATSLLRMLVEDGRVRIARVELARRGPGG